MFTRIVGTGREGEKPKDPEAANSDKSLPELSSRCGPVRHIVSIWLFQEVLRQALPPEGNESLESPVGPEFSEIPQMVAFEPRRWRSCREDFV